MALIERLYRRALAWSARWKTDFRRSLSGMCRLSLLILIRGESAKIFLTRLDEIQTKSVKPPGQGRLQKYNGKAINFSRSFIISKQAEFQKKTSRRATWVTLKGERIIAHVKSEHKKQFPLWNQENCLGTFFVSLRFNEKTTTHAEGDRFASSIEAHTWILISELNKKRIESENALIESAERVDEDYFTQFPGIAADRLTNYVSPSRHLRIDDFALFVM